MYHKENTPSNNLNIHNIRTKVEVMLIFNRMTRNINKTKKIRQEISILLKMHGNKQVFQMINILHPLNSKKKSQTNSRMIK